MNITTAQVKEIRTELAKLQPEKVTLAGNRTLSVKETVFALAPTLERMKKRGFDSAIYLASAVLLGTGRKAPKKALPLSLCALWMNCS